MFTEVPYWHFLYIHILNIGVCTIRYIVILVNIKKDTIFNPCICLVKTTVDYCIILIYTCNNNNIYFFMYMATMAFTVIHNIYSRTI